MQNEEKLNNLNKDIEKKLKITKYQKNLNRVYGSGCARYDAGSTCSVRGSLKI